MKQHRFRVLFMSCLIIVLASSAQIRSAESDQNQITCTGKVINEREQPVPGAKVRLYKLILFMETLSFEVELAQTTTSTDDGTFRLQTRAEESDAKNQTIILVDKEGMALGWVNWFLSRDLDVQIILGPSRELTGHVVDESGKPVSDAEVRISAMLITKENEPRYIAGKISEELFSCKTNAEGKFTFERIPEEATAEFIIKKPGLATVSTLRNTQEMKLQFQAGQEDIEITLPIEAKIEGRVIEKETGRAVPGIQLITFQGERQPFSGQEPVISGEDGTFTITALGEGKQIVKAVPPGEGIAEWIAQPVEVDVEAGKTLTGVKVELSKGGLLELFVTELDDNAPISGATVSIKNTVSNEQFRDVSDEEGKVRKRLAPGEYQVAYVHKQDYPNERREETFMIEDEKTSRVEVQLKGYPKVRGTVRDENGLPVAGARMKVCPWGQGETTSDREGRFEMRRDAPNRAPSVVPYVVARHFERNLAAAVEIAEDQEVVDVNMTPGVTCVGKVVDVDGKPIENAKAYLTFWSSGHGSSMAHQENTTDAEGHYEIKAVPRHHKYSVNAGAEGYGQDYVHISTEDVEDNHFEVESIALAPASLSISGIVVDSEGKPVDNVWISGQGRGQPFRRTQTNRDGRFTLENVCAGKMRITASSTGAQRLSGNIDTEGGATDVRIAISQRSSAGRSQPTRPPSLVGKSLPDLKAFGVDLSPGDIEGKRLLVCFWDMQQRPSRHCLMQIAQQAEQLKDKGVIIVAVQASKMDQAALDQWVKKYNVPFSIGMVEGDAEKTRFAWGIRSLPWLILTDREHAVEANGFSLAELDEKI